MALIVYNSKWKKFLQ